MGSLGIREVELGHEVPRRLVEVAAGLPAGGGLGHNEVAAGFGARSFAAGGGGGGDSSNRSGSEGAGAGVGPMATAAPPSRREADMRMRMAAGGGAARGDLDLQR